jgi:hypothetical protein
MMVFALLSGSIAQAGFDAIKTLDLPQDPNAWRDVYLCNHKITLQRNKICKNRQNFVKSNASPLRHCLPL